MGPFWLLSLMVTRLANLVPVFGNQDDSIPASSSSADLAWLRHSPLPSDSFDRSKVPLKIFTLPTEDGSPVQTAEDELRDAFNSIFSTDLETLDSADSTETLCPVIVLGDYESYSEAFGPPGNYTPIEEDGFFLSTSDSHVLIIGSNDRGTLYGAYEYISMLSMGNLECEDKVENPTQNIRWVNQWDNPDATIERGYGGPSIFFENGTVKRDLTRVKEYARLLASVRYNALVVNNVNAKETMLTDDNIMALGRIADVLRPYGIQMGISINFGTPKLLGELDTFDPLDEDVIQWWNTTVGKLYDSVPDMAGFVVKANSEGQPGPLTYNRTFPDGANLFARVLAPYGGVCMFRAFVYTSGDWNDTQSDRAKQAYEFFGDLDGQFDDNVVVQIKYGPIDFQVQEPASPLFGKFKRTNLAIEVQVSQEYLGQQSHFVYLPPLWRTILDFDMRQDGQQALVSDIVSGKQHDRPLGGLVAVVNVGMSDNWLGSDLALANLYASGRLAWDSTQSSECILQDWAKLTWSRDDKVVDTLQGMAMDSWVAFRNYTGVLGTLSPSPPDDHYGVNPPVVDGPKGARWFKAFNDSIGIDRTVATGTGYSGQYPSEVAQQLESVETTPEDLILFYHHLPYTHVLSDGKTIIQYIYDAHYSGAERAARYVKEWKCLEGFIDKERYRNVLYRLEYQAGHSVIWRDAMVTWYNTKTGISDSQDRIGNHPWRIQAEDMVADGYERYAVDPYFTAGNGTAMVLSSNDTSKTGSLSTTLSVDDSGTYDIGVNYYDLNTGKASWTIYLNDQEIGHWVGDTEYTLGHVSSPYVDGISAIRRVIRDVEVDKGDTVKVVGRPGGGEQGDPAPVDYIILIPQNAPWVD